MHRPGAAGHVRPQEVNPSVSVLILGGAVVCVAVHVES